MHDTLDGIQPVEKVNKLTNKNKQTSNKKYQNKSDSDGKLILVDIPTSH